VELIDPTDLSGSIKGRDNLYDQGLIDKNYNFQTFGGSYDIGDETRPDGSRLSEFSGSQEFMDLGSILSGLSGSDGTNGTNEMFANMRYEQAKANSERMTDLLTAHGANAAAAVGAFAAQAAMGQEDALEGLIATASQVAGGQIMLKGGEVMATGIAGMLTAPNPLSAAQIAGGAGLAAAGAAVQTGGPAAVSALMGKGGSSASPTGSTRDPGASPRSSGTSSGTGGPMVINVTYGAGGPLPEDVAREIHRTMRSGDRRSGR
jgi:hypothetical protein